MSDLTKILAENQKEMLKLIAPLNKKQTVLTNAQDSDSEPENVSVARTSIPVKIHTATNSKTTPVNSRYSCQCFHAVYCFFFPMRFQSSGSGFSNELRLRKSIKIKFRLLGCPHS